MSTQRQPNVPRYSIFNARVLAGHGDFQESVTNYLGVLHCTLPEGRPQYLSEFVAVLKGYFDCESEETRLMETINEACALPDLEFHIWRARSEWLYGHGDLMRSFAGFRRAINVVRSDVEWLHAVTSIENIKSNFIDAWHWRMINDGKRNCAYRDAIFAAISQMCTYQSSVNVVDIGCGCGIFSIIADRCNYILLLKEAKDFAENAFKEKNSSINGFLGVTIYACESNETMCAIAEACIRVNKGRGIHMIPRHSTQLVNFHDKCDLLITETFDCGIFGERIVESIRSAKDHMLTKSRPHIIIPQKVSAYFAIIQSEEIAMENFCEVNRKGSRANKTNTSMNHQLNKNFDETMPSTSNADSSPTTVENAAGKNKQLFTIKTTNFGASSLVRTTVDYGSVLLLKPATSEDIEKANLDKYSCEHEHPDDEYVLLSQFCYLEKRCRTKLFNLFEPTEAYTCQYLNSLPTEYIMLSEPVNGFSLDFNDTEQLDKFALNKFETEIEMTALRDGVVHAVVSWFNAQLFGDSFINTSPLGDHCWQQAVFPIYPPKVMRAGETLRCRVHVKDHKMRVCPFTSSCPKEHQSKVVLRATKDVNFALMHNNDVQNFYRRAVKEGDFQEVVDCTDLLIFSEKLRPLLNLSEKSVMESDMPCLDKNDEINPTKSVRCKTEFNKKDVSADSQVAETDQNKNIINSISDCVEMEDCENISKTDEQVNCKNIMDNINIEKESAAVGIDIKQEQKSNKDLNVIVGSDISIILHVADHSKRTSTVHKSFNSQINEHPKENCEKIALLYWPLSPRGLIMDSYFATILGLFIDFKGCAKLIPSVVRLKCRLIESNEIVERTRIANLSTGNAAATTSGWRDKHCNLDLTPMNEYCQSYVHDIELYNDFKFKYLSATFEIYAIRFDQLTKAKSCVNELTKVRQIQEVQATQSGVCTAVLHWFEFSDGYGNELRLPEEITKLPNSTCPNENLSNTQSSKSSTANKATEYDDCLVVSEENSVLSGHSDNEESTLNSVLSDQKKEKEKIFDDLVASLLFPKDEEYFIGEKMDNATPSAINNNLNNVSQRFSVNNLVGGNRQRGFNTGCFSETSAAVDSPTYIGLLEESGNVEEELAFQNQTLEDDETSIVSSSQTNIETNLDNEIAVDFVSETEVTIKEKEDSRPSEPKIQISLTSNVEQQQPKEAQPQPPIINSNSCKADNDSTEWKDDNKKPKQKRKTNNRVWSKASAYVMDRPVNVIPGTMVRIEASLYHGNVVFHSVLDTQHYSSSPEFFQRQQLETLYQKQARRMLQQAALLKERENQELL